MRGQSGTPDLRALAYMDEVFGYVPPTAAPPAKKPILTILKQGRAFGLGLVALDPEPRRPRLQGDVERRHLARRAAADRERQGARARGAPLGRRRRPTSPRSTRRSAASRSGSSCSSRAKASAAAAVRDPLGDVVPARAADEGAGRAPDAATRRRSPHAPRRRDTASGAPPRRARRRRDAVAPAVAAGVAGLATSTRRRRGRRAVGATAGSTRLRAVPRRARRRCATTTAPPASTSSRSSRRSTARSTAASTSRARPQVDFDDRDFSRRAARRRGVRAPAGARSARRRSSRDARRTIQRTLVDAGRSSCTATATLKLVSRPGETAEAFARALRRGGAGSGPTRRRRRSATGSRRSATGSRTRSHTARRRVEELDAEHALPPGERADRRRRRGARRAVRRQGGAPARSRARGSAAPPRGAGCPLAPAERKRTAEAKVEDAEDDLAELEQEILDEVAEIDEAWAVTADRSTSLRSGSRRPTSACSRRRCSGCRPTDSSERAGPGRRAPEPVPAHTRAIAAGPP